MLIIVYEVTNIDVEIDGFMIGGLVGEAELVNPFLPDDKLILFAYLITKIMNLLTGRSLYLNKGNSKPNISLVSLGKS